MKSLKNKEVIDEIFKVGKKVSTKTIYAKFIVGEPEIVISAPMKLFKRAVDRNRIKRLVRESIKNKINNDFSIAFVYNTDKIESFSTIEKDIKIIFDKLNFSRNEYIKLT